MKFLFSNYQDGKISKGDHIVAESTKELYEVQEVGILAPELSPTSCLVAGQVGYLIPGIRSIKSVRVGDTLYHHNKRLVFISLVNISAATTDTAYFKHMPFTQQTSGDTPWL
jgi:translation elongation factor EF-4